VVPILPPFSRARFGLIQYYTASMNPQIVAICGPLAGLVFMLIEGRDLKIGRGRNNHVRLDDPRVALRHCCIAYEYGHCLLFVLENERGTFVNEFARSGKVLVHGDRIKIGVSIFVFFDREE
jgi:pSer/pThr/pTyr-binding forkhead associated (FHA) protein